MAQIDDVITYLEMRARPVLPRIPARFAKLALMRAEECTVSFYRYLYETVGTPWLWYERRLIDDAALLAEIAKPTTEIFVLYVGGVPAGYFELDAASGRETELRYFGLAPEFIGRKLGPFCCRRRSIKPGCGRSNGSGCIPAPSTTPGRSACISAPASSFTPASRCASRIRGFAASCRAR